MKTHGNDSRVIPPSLAGPESEASFSRPIKRPRRQANRVFPSGRTKQFPTYVRADYANACNYLRQRHHSHRCPAHTLSRLHIPHTARPGHRRLFLLARSRNAIPRPEQIRVLSLVAAALACSSRYLHKSELFHQIRHCIMQGTCDTQGSRSCVRKWQKPKLLEPNDLRAATRDRTTGLLSFSNSKREATNPCARTAFSMAIAQPAAGTSSASQNKIYSPSRCVNPYISCVGSAPPCRGVNKTKMRYPQGVLRDYSPRLSVEPLSATMTSHAAGHFWSASACSVSSIVRAALRHGMMILSVMVPGRQSPRRIRLGETFACSAVARILASKRGTANKDVRAASRSWDHSAGR